MRRCTARVVRRARKGLPACTLLAFSVLLASPPTPGDQERRLVFYNTHTGKRLDVVYARDGRYVPAALTRINAFLGDFRTGDSKRIDPKLLDLVYDIRRSLGGKGTYEVISAYRSPETNEMLRSRSDGVAKKSQHLVGKAIDVRLTGVPLDRLRDRAMEMRRGGVGFYPDSDFVHIDTGRVRYW